MHIVRVLKSVEDKFLSHGEFTHWEEWVHLPLMLDE